MPVLNVEQFKQRSARLANQPSMVFALCQSSSPEPFNFFVLEDYRVVHQARPHTAGWPASTEDIAESGIASVGIVDEGEVKIIPWYLDALRGSRLVRTGEFYKYHLRGFAYPDIMQDLVEEGYTFRKPLAIEVWTGVPLEMRYVREDVVKAYASHLIQQSPAPKPGQ
jgi:hypothetical protein